jgi:hypothetical protein
MPTWNNSADAVQRMIREKQELEVSLAWELLAVFNETKSLIGWYRHAVERALAEMLTVSYTDEKMTKLSEAGEAVKQAIDAEKAAMKLLTRVLPGEVPPTRKSDNTFATNPRATVSADVKEPKDLLNLLKDVDTFDAQDCSDVVRLYGAFVEKAGPKKIKTCIEKAEADYEKLEKARKSGQKGINTEWYDVWNQDWKDKDKKAKFGRHRDRVPTQYEDVMSKKRSQLLSVQEFLISFKGGQSIWQLKETSTIGKIDSWLGLVPAADISGTTTDTIFFIQRFFGQMFLGEVDKMFYMLPLATIVAGAHHSTLEVALPLSQNGLLDYSIGKYSSLMIPSSTGNAGAGELKKALDAAEKHKQNHLMMVAYSGDPKKPASMKPMGAYVFDGKESGDFFKLSNAKKLAGLMQKEECFPTQSQVRNFLQKNGFPKVE